MKHLFKNFLENKRVYGLNEHYYQSMLSEVLNKDVKPFYTTTFGNGTKFFNANPMFSAKHDNRIIRIIQYKPSSKPRIKAWLDSFDDMEELVITLELTDQFTPIVRKFAEQWLVEKLSKEEMKEVISSASSIKIQQL